MLKSKKLQLVAHTHPDYGFIEPSADDRDFLKYIGQRKSVIISYIIGREMEFTSNIFDDFVEVTNMLTVNEAKNIGIRACIEKLGLEFCKKHADNATSGFSEEDGYVNCFVGVNDKPGKKYDISKVKKLVLTSQTKWSYAARCNVSLDDGKIEFSEFRRPN